MALAEHLSSEIYLNDRHVHFEVAPHAGAFTAVSEARALGMPRDEVLKAVVLRTSEDFVVAVVPASKRLDMTMVADALGDPRVRLATENEIVTRFPGYELGALPPLPGLLGVRAYIDPGVFDHARIAFADGRQTESFVVDPHELFWGEDAIVCPIAWEPGTWARWDREGPRFAVE
ncbi:MAG: aminoacyl-tRNA deacylase [Actinomycetota bacterium]